MAMGAICLLHWFLDVDSAFYSANSAKNGFHHSQLVNSPISMATNSKRAEEN